MDLIFLKNSEKITDSINYDTVSVNFLYAIRYYDKGPLSKHWTIFYQSFQLTSERTKYDIERTTSGWHDVASSPFFENWKKVHIFWKKYGDCVNVSLQFLI